MQLPFTKYQGTGNDFVMIENRGQDLERRLTEAQVAQLCDRRFGIGADGLILLSDAREPGVDFRMIYYNSDGRESSMCGNGGRCVVAFAREKAAFEGNGCQFEAIDGLHSAQIDARQVALGMGRPRGFRSLTSHEYWLDTGSPHHVRLTQEPVQQLDVVRLGRAIRYSDAYQAGGGTNVNFVNVLAPNHLSVRTYERGVEDETYSCGTGVTACAYTYLREKGGRPDAPVQLDTPGGSLQVRVEQMGSDQEQITLVGPAQRTFAGSVDL